MTTITINGFIHAQKHPWKNELDYSFMIPEDMAEHGYMMICPYTMEFELPHDFNPISAEVAILEKKLGKLADEYHTNVSQVKDKIQSLLCIGHTTVIEDDDDSIPF